MNPARSWSPATPPLTSSAICRSAPFPACPRRSQPNSTSRGCLIPQTYEAHRPENVIHASLERAGSSDWAVLCSERGTVSLLVYFSSDPAKLLVLAASPETERLQAHDPAAFSASTGASIPPRPSRFIRPSSAWSLARPIWTTTRWPIRSSTTPLFITSI